MHIYCESFLWWMELTFLSPRIGNYCLQYRIMKSPQWEPGRASAHERFLIHSSRRPCPPYRDGANSERQGVKAELMEIPTSCWYTIFKHLSSCINISYKSYFTFKNKIHEYSMGIFTPQALPGENNDYFYLKITKLDLLSRLGSKVQGLKYGFAVLRHCKCRIHAHHSMPNTTCFVP